MSERMLTAYEIAESEYEKQLELNGSLPYGLESIDPGGFYPLDVGDGVAKLMPGPEFNKKLYRGQSSIYNPCKPSLYRKDLSEAEKVVEKMRFLQYKEKIKHLPNVVQFSSAKILHYSLFVDYYGLAQHYGLKTDLIDFSSDPFVAAFFATTYFDKEKKKYLPIEDEHRNGIFYCFDLDGSGGFNCNQADIVGAQPFIRPMKQRAFSIRVPEKSCLHQNPNVMYQKFRHDKKAANKVYEIFEGGETLIPSDPVSKMADSISLQSLFSEEIFLRSLECLEIKRKPEEMKKELGKAGVEIVEEHTGCLFSNEDIKIIEKSWENIKEELSGNIYVRPVFQLL